MTNILLYVTHTLKTKTLDAKSRIQIRGIELLDSKMGDASWMFFFSALHIRTLRK